MTKFIANHVTAIMAIVGMATGLVGGGMAEYRIMRYEQHHVAVQAKGNNGHHRGER